MKILKIEELQEIYKNVELHDNFKELIFNMFEDKYLTFNLESGSPKSKFDIFKMFSDKLNEEMEKIHEKFKNTNKETYYQISIEPDEYNSATYIVCKAFKKRTISEFISMYYDKLKKEIEEEELELKIEKDKIELFKQENSKPTLELEKMIKNGEV